MKDHKQRHLQRFTRLTVILLLLLAGGCSLWLRTQQRQYKLNRQLLAALVHVDHKQALALVNAGADPNTPYAPTHLPPLLDLVKQLFHWSPLRTNNSPTALLIACGATWNDDTATKLAQENAPDASQLVQVMLEHGAKVNVRDKNRWSPLMWAAYCNQQHTIEVLIDYAADVNAIDEHRWTPLMVACVYDVPPDVLCLLLKHGANVNAQDDQGWTALCHASFVGADKHIVQALLAYGADPNLAANDDNTPLTLAQGSPAPDLVTLLKRAGAKK